MCIRDRLSRLRFLCNSRSKSLMMVSSICFGVVFFGKYFFIRKIGRENRISKSAFFISKAGKIVRSQLADIQRKMYKIVPAERQKRFEKTITKNRCKPSKIGLQRSFLAPPAGFEPVACRLGVLNVLSQQVVSNLL